MTEYKTYYDWVRDTEYYVRYYLETIINNHIEWDFEPSWEQRIYNDPVGELTFRDIVPGVDPVGYDDIVFAMEEFMVNEMRKVAYLQTPAVNTNNVTPTLPQEVREEAYEKPDDWFLQ